MPIISHILHIKYYLNCNKLSRVLRVLQHHRIMINSPSGINELIPSGNKNIHKDGQLNLHKDITKYLRTKYLMKSGEP